jgi:hypothetical protein
VQEIQAITTSTYTGPNEIQSITTSADVVTEKQVVELIAPAVKEVQQITLKLADSGRYFLRLDTSLLGGSLQDSGYIYTDYPEDDSSGVTFGKNLASIISSMSNVRPNGDVEVSLVAGTPSDTKKYLVTFPESMGNVPEMTIVTSELNSASGAQPEGSVSTATEGNVIAGSYTLTFEGKTTAAIASDATENDVRVALEALSTIGSVIVTRSQVDYQHGYRWTIEFNSELNAGNVQTLIADGALLTSSNVANKPEISVSSTDGNEIGGTFTVTFNNNGNAGTSDDIPYDATAAEFKAALEAIPGNVIPTGTIAVSRVGPDAQRGYTWTVTFLSDYARTFEGDLNLFLTTVTDLTGQNAQATPLEVRKGTEKEVQLITTTDAVQPSTMMRLHYDGHVTDGIKLSPASGTCSSSIVEVQTITTSTVRLKFSCRSLFSDDFLYHFLFSAF